MKSTKLWPLPIRLFHWSLVVTLTVSFVTGFSGNFEWIDYHAYAGYTALCLILFRIVFGFIAPGTGRFTNFVRGPAAIISYVKGNTNVWGHNPLGALSVLALLFLVGVQATTGLFTNDDIFFEGPLAHLVGYETSLKITTVHHINKTILLVFIALHFLAILYYELLKKDRLVLPMITGRKHTEEDRQDEPASLVLASVIVVVAAGVTWYLVNEI